MFIRARARRALVGAAAVAATAALTAPSAFAHEERDVGGYKLEVGFIDEPVFVGERSGLEVFVHKGDQPVAGLEQTLKAQAAYGSSTLDLPLSADEDDPSHYESVFIPTAAGPYTFHLTGSIEGNPIDERFTSSPTGFDEVHDLASGEFPDQLPSIVDVAAQAQKGEDAAGLVPVAIGIGIVGVVVGLVSLGVALAGRRRPV
ncbi:MAG TPA: hypothetical protein VGK63_11155 [Candidatus Limnocylindrales bacterium]